MQTAGQPSYQQIDQATAEAILGGDYDKLVATAKARAGTLTRTKLRRLYAEAVRIHFLLDNARSADNGWRRLRMFEPRLAYEARRDQRDLSLRGACSDLALLAKGVKEDKERFQRFIDYFEALVAYSRGR